jgi:hypothetical protein
MTLRLRAGLRSAAKLGDSSQRLRQRFCSPSFQPKRTDEPPVANDSLIPTAPHDLQPTLRTGRLCLEPTTCMQPVQASVQTVQNPCCCV